ncbi:MAG: hypothetical protein ACJ72W_06435 [Actinoallomurus sp.]
MVVWGQAYGDVPSAAAQDPFAVVERDTRAMVTAGWWPATPPLQRQNLVAGRMLVLPDGTWWLFGAWARWYRRLPADGQWHLCPPPRLPMTRTSARPLGQGMPVPRIPPHLVPSGPDFGAEPPQSLPFVDADVRPEVTSRVRATVESAAALPPHDYPHWWNVFSSATPSTVAVGWGVMLWSATAPVFYSGLDAQLLGLWSPYRSRPLPQADGPRWLTPPPMEGLVGLYAERLRAGRVDAAVVILRTMWAMASALREDPRFRARADALLAILGATLHNPTVDYAALPYGDQAIVQQWLTRCPPVLTPALRVEASAGEHFRNTFYDLAVCLASTAGDPAEHGYVEPRLIAAALLAADLAVVRRDVAGQVIGWLDPETRRVTQAILTGTDHPLRRFWPQGNRLPPLLRRRVEALRPAARGALLATVYAADLAWCRLGGGIPARPRGFPVPVAVLAEILGSDRARSAAPADPVTPTPGLAPLARQYPAAPAAPPGVPPVAHQPSTGPPGQAPTWAAPPVAATAVATADAGTSRPAPAGVAAAPGVPGPLVRPRPDDAARPADAARPGDAARPCHAERPGGAAPGSPRTRVLGEGSGTRILGEQPERPGTRIMSQTMMGDLLGAPMPGRPVGEIEPPPSGTVLPEVTERFGTRFVSGTDDLAGLLDDVHRGLSSGAETSPALLVVGAPHSGQRRFARLVARTLADAGAGDGSVRTLDGTELDSAEALDAALRAGLPLLVEWIDAALRRASEPAAVASAVIRSRESGRPALIATCEPGAYDRLKTDFPDLTGVFRVFRLPDLADPESRLALVHVVTDERRVTVNAPALHTVKADLPRLKGYGDLVNARLVEAYLDRAVARHTDRFGASRDRLVLAPEDFSGVAEEIEPALRAPGDVDGFLRALDEMIGLDEVKQTVGGLVAEARLAAERVARGLPPGNPSRHLIFLGRPGTGKRTVAGLVGGVYAALNLLDSGQVIVCDARELAGDDAADKVAAQVDRAAGGVLLIEDASLLDRMSGAVTALLRHMEDRRDKFLVICSSEAEEMDGFLLADPGFRAEFGGIVEFRQPTDRQLVQLFSRFAERELYLLDEELRVELLGRFGEMRRSRGFAFAETVRRLFDAIVARQAARLAGARVDAATVARLTVRDLPESPAERLLQSLHEDRTRR